jgi:hypothetical protein
VGVRLAELDQSLLRTCWKTVPDHPRVWSELVKGHGGFKDLIVTAKSEGDPPRELEREG